MQGFDPEQHEVRLDLAVHPDWEFALFGDAASAFTVGSGSVTNSTALDTGGLPGYRLHSVGIKVSGCDPAAAGPCSMFVRLDEAAITDAPGVEVALGVWTASLRFWLWTQAEADRPPVAARAAASAYARDGLWQVDVLTFEFGDEVFVAKGGVQQSLLETQVCHSRCRSLQYCGSHVRSPEHRLSSRRDSYAMMMTHAIGPLHHLQLPVLDIGCTRPPHATNRCNCAM